MPEEQEYEDYIAYTPQRFMLTDAQQFEIAKDHSTIITALSEGNMSVKEIHDLYTIPGSNKHTKTLKTIYRYMETLEEAGLVKVAGYRKYTKKRATEKLYCRTARVFFNRDAELKEQWLKTPEGQEYIEALAEILWSINDQTAEPPPKLKTLLAKHIQETQTQVNRIIDKITSDEKAARLLDTYRLNHIQNALSFVSQLQATLTLDTREQLLKTLNQKPD